MPAEERNTDYRRLSSASAKNGGAPPPREPNTLVPLDQSRKLRPNSQKPTAPQTLQRTKRLVPSESFPVERENLWAESVVEPPNFTAENGADGAAAEELSHGETHRRAKKAQTAEKNRRMLSGDRWLARNGHILSFVGLYLFSILVLFRPYDLIPALGFLSATAFYFALATLAVYLPAQFTAEGNLTILTTEVKAILALVVIAVVTMPIAKSPGTAWQEFNDTLSKSVIMFIIMVNVIRTRRRLMMMIGLSMSIGVLLSYMALGMYLRGETMVEGYRVGLKVGGMFENPNEMSLHLVTMIPLAVALAVAAKSKLGRVFYIAMAVMMLCANMITYSRGGFLGLIASSGVLVWKLGRKNRVGVTLVSGVIGVLVAVLAPGNFGLRVLSIFIPGLDGAGSSSQRNELLQRSILVTMRNPWGIGIGNFPIVGINNLVTHNAYTQVSSELGLLGLAAYLVFLFSPFRKLGAIEQTQFEKNETDWFYYLAIGLQASLTAYFVSSFFAAVAYTWFIYYLIAYSVTFRRVYRIEKNLSEEVQPQPLAAKFQHLKAT